MAADDKHQLPPFVLRVASNLEDEPLSDLLRLTSVVLENARQFMVGVAKGSDVAIEIDALYKPWISELLRRSFELETRPASRGNA